ncbi:hypothetical protein D915_004646 [Fasciola hepatica]|uniref:Uncharacterized protein n=1 Tax=Fasciola hepatica TaxID=6192 RepID=A0A4E0R7R1_FASHE|nr:hypothetical protein D915_004646 [Fasciola hepatica]
MLHVCPRVPVYSVDSPVLSKPFFSSVVSGAEETPDANVISLEIEIRATHCMEVEQKKNITIQFECRFDEEAFSKNATINVRNKGQPVTDLDLRMYVNTSDVYPGDTIQINTTLKNTDLSQCECKLLMLDLHAGPWAIDGELVDTNKNNTSLNKTDLRRMEIRCTFIADQRYSYFCVFKNSFHTRGLRIIPTKPVIKHKITQSSVQLYGIPFKKDVHQFDPCIKQYTLAPEEGPKLPEPMLLFNRSFIRVRDILIICHPVPELATFSYPRMKCTGLVDGVRLKWFDLGPMVSQVITYRNEDKRYFALGPERNSIVTTRDLTDRWIGISLSGYRKYIDGKIHVNATYLPWDETRTFNKNLFGLNCTEFVADDWNCELRIYSRSKEQPMKVSCCLNL